MSRHSDFLKSPPTKPRRRHIVSPPHANLFNPDQAEGVVKCATRATPRSWLATSASSTPPQTPLCSSCPRPLDADDHEYARRCILKTDLANAVAVSDTQTSS